MQQRGKLVILFMFTLALGLSAYAWWHQYRENPQCKAFWGQRANLLIQRAESVEFLTLSAKPESADASAAGDSLFLGKKNYSVIFSDIHKVPGLVHARHALIDDNSYMGSAPANACDPEWEFGLRFRDGADQITVLFDTHCDAIFWVEGAKTARLVTLSAKAFRKKRDDWEGKRRSNPPTSK